MSPGSSIRSPHPGLQGSYQQVRRSTGRLVFLLIKVEDRKEVIFLYGTGYYGRGGGGEIKFYPYKKGSFIAGHLCMSHTGGGGGGGSFHPLEGLGGIQVVLPCLNGGRRKFRTCDFPIL